LLWLRYILRLEGYEAAQLRSAHLLGGGWRGLPNRLPVLPPGGGLPPGGRPPGGMPPGGIPPGGMPPGGPLGRTPPGGIPLGGGIPPGGGP